MSLRRLPFHRVLHRPGLFLGGEREPALITAIVAGGLAVSGMNTVSFVVGATVWFGAIPLLRWMAKADPPVWESDQIRLLFDSILRDYPFGSLLLWETRFLEVPYRDFILDFRRGMTFIPKIKAEGKPMKMVLDGQQRMQSLYVGICGSYDGRRLYFNVTSGPGFKGDDTEELDGRFRFEFWQDADQVNRPKRLIRVADIVEWSPRLEDAEIKNVIQTIPLEGDDIDRAARNMRLLHAAITRTDLVPIETIDEEVRSAGQARTISEILDIFVRVNSGGTRLTRSDLMLGLISTRWSGARQAFDELVGQVDPDGSLGIDKDLVIRGLLLVSDATVAFDVQTVERHWDSMASKFDCFAAALRAAIDFCREPEVGILSASLLSPIVTLLPLVYYLSLQRGGSVPDGQRHAMRMVLYFLLFNGFLRGNNPQARLRWIREVLARNNINSALPVDEILAIIKSRQRGSFVATSADMLNWNPRLALNIVQPGVCRETLSWQAKAEVDHIFPQSVYRSRFPDMVDDIGNLAYLGKLRNIRKTDQPPWEYFKQIPDDELERNFLIQRSLLADDKFDEFVASRRERVTAVVKTFLGR